MLIMCVKYSTKNKKMIKLLTDKSSLTDQTYSAKIKAASKHFHTVQIFLIINQLDMSKYNKSTVTEQPFHCYISRVLTKTGS